jgi:hypothetical protein
MDDSTFNRVIEILRLTKDGNDLSPSDLRLTEIIANASILSESEEVAFAELYEAVKNGRYEERNRFHGIQHLTKAHNGYVKWKGSVVDHYSFNDAEKEREAALKLAETCKMLEEKGFPVNSWTVLDPKFEQAPKGTPWLNLMMSLYTMAFEDKKLVAMVLNKAKHRAVIVEKGPDNQAKVREFDVGDGTASRYRAVETLSLEGRPSQSLCFRTYDGLVAALEAGGFKPSEIDQALA